MVGRGLTAHPSKIYPTFVPSGLTAWPLLNPVHDKVLRTPLVGRSVVTLAVIIFRQSKHWRSTNRQTTLFLIKKTHTQRTLKHSVDIGHRSTDTARTHQTFSFTFHSKYTTWQANYSNVKMQHRALTVSDVVEKNIHSLSESNLIRCRRFFLLSSSRRRTFA